MPFIIPGESVMRKLLIFLALYVGLGWLLLGLPNVSCTSEERARDADNCGTAALVRKSLLWPLVLLQR